MEALSEVVSDERQAHSGLGIASFAIGLVAIAGIIFTFAWAGMVVATTGHPSDPNSPVAMMIGLAIVIWLVCALSGVVVGIVGIFQRNRKKVFVHIGFGINVAIVVVTIAVIALGISASHGLH